MKLRVLERDAVLGQETESSPTKVYIPQYFDDETSEWFSCEWSGWLEAKVYYDMNEAIEACEKYATEHPELKVVWEKEY